MFNPFKAVAKVVTPHLAKKKEEVAELGEELGKVVTSVEASVQAQKERLQAIIEESKELQAKLQDASEKYDVARKKYDELINKLEAVEFELDQVSPNTKEGKELLVRKEILEAEIKIQDKAMLKHAKKGAGQGKELKQLDSEIDALSAAIDEAEKHLATKDEEELKKIQRRLDNLGEDGALFSDIIGIANNVGSLYAAAHGQKQEGTSGEVVDTFGNAMEGNVGGALKSARGLIVSGVGKAIDKGHDLMREFEDKEAKLINATRRLHYQRHGATGMHSLRAMERAKP